MSGALEQKPVVTLDALLQRVEAYNPHFNRELLERAYAFAEEAHAGQKRLTGDDYITHPLSVALLLTELELDDASLAAALLHDIIEDTEHNLDVIRKQFGEEIAFLVSGVTKLRQIQFDTRREHQAENLRRMLLAMARDLRVILIKLADRLHNMRTLAPMPDERKKEVARETLQVFAPIAHRLGIWRYKWDLEDMALRYLEPEKYEEIVKAVARTPRRADGSDQRGHRATPGTPRSDGHRGGNGGTAEALLQHLP